MRTGAPSVRVLRTLTDSGQFAVGIVLVRMHAFIALGTAAQPLRYLDYLIEAPERAIVVDGSAVLVGAPALTWAGFAPAGAVEHATDERGSDESMLSAT